MYRFIYLVVFCYISVLVGFFSFLSRVFWCILAARPHLVLSPVLTAGVQLNLKVLKQKEFYL